MSEKKTDPEIDEMPLNSECGVDYTKLRNLLAEGKWREADQETTQVMLKAARCEEWGWLRVEDIDNFPCSDLRTIDQLWVKYSQGHFGFSVQKRIYESLGGTREYNKEIYEAFGDRVGWRQGGKWVREYSNLKFNLQAPEAHLPVDTVRRRWRCIVSQQPEPEYLHLNILLSRKDL